MTDTVVVAETINFDELSRVKLDSNLLTAFSITIFAYALQFMVFPSYTELEKRSNERFQKSYLLACCINSTCYMIVAIAALLMFGGGTKSNFLVNMS